MSSKINFLNLEVWKEAKDIAVEIFRLTDSEQLLKERALRDQIRRCSLSISSNIAEGSSRGGKKEFKYFLRIAKGSCGECISQLIVLQDLGYIDTSLIKELIDRLTILLKRIGKLDGSLSKD